MAVTLTALALAEAAGIPTVPGASDGDPRTSPVAVRLLPVVSARIERYAPDAPDATANEAAVRLASYLNSAQPNPNEGGSLAVGEIHLTRSAHSHAAAFRVSGAAGLLSPWRVRRAVTIEAAD